MANRRLEGKAPSFLSLFSRPPNGKKGENDVSALSRTAPLPSNLHADNLTPISYGTASAVKVAMSQIR